MPVRISLAMIVKDEEQVLGRILAQASGLCDELVIVDTGSSDNTVALAKSFGAEVFHFQWIEDFSAARNHAFAQCTGDWILWLDADDVLTDANREKLLELKESVLNEHLDAVACSYQITFDGFGNCLVSIPRERLLRNGAGGQWQFPIHESYVLPENAVILNRLDIAIEHHKPAAYVARSSDRNLNMLAHLISQGDQEARTFYYYGKELYQHGRYDEAIQAFARHVELNEVDLISRYQAMHQAMLCCMALERCSEALEWGMRAMATDGSRAEAYVEMGVVHYRRQAYAAAIPVLLMATNCSPPQTGMIMEENYSWRPYHYLSLCYEGLGQYRKAIEAALNAYEDIPDKQVIQDNIICFTRKL
jgi:tetratricopeptide (TPR) repeat protein